VKVVKVALVTGAARRIGRGIAEHLLARDYQVLLHANTSIDELTSWAERHSRSHQVVGCFHADLASAAGQEGLCRAVKSKVDRLDLLVHNASLFARLSFKDIDREHYRLMQSVNLEAPYFITQSLVALLKNSLSGCVINIIDAMWQRPVKNYSHYAVSKAGLFVLTRALACELAPDIRVCGVSPGAIAFQSFHDQDTRSAILKKIPLKRLGNYSDIAHAVEFLAERAPYITGEIISVDGGRSIAS